MSDLRFTLRTIAEEFCHEHRLSIIKLLGDGNDGAVWATNLDSAVKVLEREDSYFREKAAYLRLRKATISHIDGFAVPDLLRSDDTRKVIEMTIVFPPSLIDFAKSYVDHPPDFSAEVLADWEDATAELFEPAQWPTVQSILANLRSMGIHYFDARPWNIRFREENTP